MHTYTSSFATLEVGFATWNDIYQRLKAVDMLNEYLYNEETIVFGTVGLVIEPLEKQIERGNRK